METCKYGLGAGARKPTAEKPQGVLYRAYAQAKGATFSLSPENCQADPNLLSRQDISPKQ